MFFKFLDVSRKYRIKFDETTLPNNQEVCPLLRYK